jgi:2'-5' RNA ligase
MSAMTRTFLAVFPPDPTREGLAAVRDEVWGYVPGLRWVDPTRLHLTLAFLGDVPTEAVDRIAALVADRARSVRRFDLRIAGLGAFPKADRARVLWAGVLGAEAEVRKIQRAVAGAAAEAGHPPPDSRFHPHITLARARKAALDLSPILGRFEGRQFPPLPVDSVATVASDLSPEGPTYRVVHSAPLSGGSA